jgi:hypothetical protein
VQIDNPADGAAERRILINAIVSKEFLARISGKLPSDPLRSEWSNLVLGWCQDFYMKYQDAPKKNIEDIFQQWARTAKNKGTVTNINKVLTQLNGQYEKNTESVNFSLDMAERFFNQVQLELLQEKMRVRLERGDVDNAISDQASFRKINLKTPPFINIMEDKEAQRRALENKQRVLIRFTGAAGEFFGEEFAEDSFVGLMAQAKGGKSYSMLELGWRAFMQGRNVAYFQIGDLSQDQVMRRFQKRAAYRPLQSKLVRFPTSIVVPEDDPRAMAEVAYEAKVYDKPLDRKLGERAFQACKEKYKGDIRLSYHPTRTVNVIDIRNILETWDKEGWEAKVVIIDYAGNLAPLDGRILKHEQVDHSWSLMRQISEARKCCVITANQSNRESFRAWVLTRNHFRDSLMVLAHVTAFIGVNMTDEEKESEVVRYNFVARREEKFSESRCLYCASCLDAGTTMVKTYLPGAQNNE